MHLSLLHICSDFSNQKLYGDLVSHLDDAGIRQIVFAPVRSQAELSFSNIGTELAQFRFVNILKPWHRLFFRCKINTIIKALSSHVDIKSVDVMHAHFLYSDGAVALHLHKTYGTPYIVAVRNTDINYFMKLRPDLKFLCFDILRHAHQVVFVTPCYRELLLKRLPRRLRDRVQSKSVIVPNGLSEFWMENLHVPLNSKAQNIRLLYVGDFSKNKNIPNIIRAAKLLIGKSVASLSLVGAGGDGESLVDEMLASGEFPFVKRFGRIIDRQELLSIYRDHDILVMPSFRETFGIAYLEALSQGLPVIYSKGQGIDGYFGDGEVGEWVYPNDVIDIKNKIESIIDHLSVLPRACVQGAKKFNWREIADIYSNIYHDAADSRTHNLGIKNAFCD